MSFVKLYRFFIIHSSKKLNCFIKKNKRVFFCILYQSFLKNKNYSAAIPD